MLDAFDGGHTQLTLSEIARRAGLPVATAHRFVGDLCAARLLGRRADGSYEIGARMWRLGLLAPPTTLREIALPHLQDLVLATGHTTHLAVLDGAGALVVERLAGSRTQATRHSPGVRLPLHATAVGKVLLAHGSAELQELVITGELRRFTPWTTTTPAVLRRQLDEIRRTGLAKSAQEHRIGVSSLAVPVQGSAGAVAALAVLAPLSAPRFGGAVGSLRSVSAAVGAAMVTASMEGPVISEESSQRTFPLNGSLD